MANYYQELSEEATVREGTGVKRYFYEVLFEKNKKVTGTSTLAETTRGAQSIHRDILVKEAAQSMGLPDEDEEIAGHYESDNDDNHEEDDDDCADFIGEVISPPAASASTSGKRKSPPTPAEQNSKNSRPSNPRGTTAGAAAEAYCGSGPKFAELPALTADANDDANDAAATAAESSYDDADDVTFTNPNPTSPEEQNEGNN